MKGIVNEGHEVTGQKEKGLGENGNGSESTRQMK